MPSARSHISQNRLMRRQTTSVPVAWRQSSARSQRRYLSMLLR
ncbi:hypothetical protein PHMEG_00026772, partial [Phytophthora megakarya]